MDSILASLGLNKSAPNPADYNTASDIGKQLATVKGGISTTLTTIGLSLTTFKALGIKTAVLDTLGSLQSKAKALLNRHDLTPAELEKQRSIIHADLMSTHSDVASGKYNTVLSAVQVSYEKVLTRVNQVAADKKTSAPLLADYRTLLKDVSGTVLSVRQSNPAMAGSTASTTDSGMVFYTPPTDITTPEDAANRLYDLDTRKDRENTGEFNWSRLYKKVYDFFFTTFVATMFGIVVILSMLLGGSVTSNAYISEWKGNRIYYFIYGGLLFPLTVFYGLLFTPYWCAYILPLNEYIATAVTKAVGGGTTVTTPFDTTAPASEDRTSYFTYSLIGSTPTAAQTSNRSMLRMLCLIDIILLAGFGTLYGMTDTIVNAVAWNV